MKVIKLLHSKDIDLLKSVRITTKMWNEAKSGVIRIEEPCEDECDLCPHYPCDDKDLTILVEVEAIELDELPDHKLQELYFKVRE